MDRQPNPGLLRRVCLRLLDGGHPWGSLDLQPDRFGVIRHRMVVFPPGISESERRRVRVARGWPAWGAVVWISCEISLSGLIEPRIAFAISTATCLALGLAARAVAGEPRTQVRTMAVTVMAGHRDAVSDATLDTLRNLAEMLFDADERRAKGQITAIEHEAIWWRVYDDQMASGHPLTR
jgi:hypothetical protein